MKENLQTGTVIHPPSRKLSSIRVMWPLIGWLYLVLVLYGIRLHQRWIEKTRLEFSVSLEGKSTDYQVVTKLDGETISGGQRISLGRHTFTVSHPKGDGFTTNLMTWYGGHDLGTINLKRTKGTLQTALNRRAKNLTIRGAEWSLELTNTSGGTWLVPTDRYQIEAQFAFTTVQDGTVVSANSTSTVRVAPALGTVHITSSHPGTGIRMAGKNNHVQVSAEVPIMIDEVPAGEYELAAERSGDQQLQTVLVIGERTNEVLLTFSYGALALETQPEGAVVFDPNGRERGRTPIYCPELLQGSRQFRFEREGYEPVFALIEINANQTNHFLTNLVSRQYAVAIKAARTYFYNGQFDEAAKSADEALRYKEDDTNAMSIKREAIGNGHLYRAKASAQGEDYSSAIEELKSAAEFMPENADIGELTANYTERQKKVLEREAERRAKERVEEQRRARINSLKMRLAVECRRYNGFEAFAVHELSSTNDLKIIAKNIPIVMTDSAPTFELSRYEWQQDDFVMHYKQNVTDGSRQCVIVGGQVSTNECGICFRVIENQTPHNFNWLGGLITAQLTTEGDRTGDRAARFEQRAKEGAEMVEQRIRRACALSP